MRRCTASILTLGAGTALVPCPARCDIIEFTDKQAWNEAVGEFRTADFAELPDGTVLQYDYSNIGVRFWGGTVACCDDVIFPNDGAGVEDDEEIGLQYSTYQRWIAVDFPGTIRIDLFRGGELIHSSALHGTGVGSFVGLLSDEPFDGAVLYDPADNDVVLVDDLHFGGAPGIDFIDKDDWIAAVGTFTTIGFTEFPGGTTITDQYANLGVSFPDGGNTVVCCNSTVYPEDGAGFDGWGNITLSFATPQSWIGVDHPGYLEIELYDSQELIHTFPAGFNEYGGNFAGVVSMRPFDTAVVTNPGGYSAVIDDLHFTPLCLGEQDGDGLVGIADLLFVIGAWASGDGETGIADFLNVLGNWGPCSHFLDCDDNGVFDLVDLDAATSPDCNANAVPDQCDVANGASPDFNANDIPDECDRPSNDRCDESLSISSGATPFLTFGATTGGPEVVCGDDLLTFANDIWFLYTAPCTGFATFSLCNDASFDTVLAVYAAVGCSAVFPQACNDDAAGCGATSKVQLFVVKGAQYRVRLGGATEGGIGVLTVSCVPDHAVSRP